MTEFLLALSLVSAALVPMAGVLGAEWDRMRCSVLAFETGHRRLIGEPSILRGVLAETRAGVAIRVSETKSTVKVQATCGRAREEIEFVRLEAARWQGE